MVPNVDDTFAEIITKIAVIITMKVTLKSLNSNNSHR